MHQKGIWCVIIFKYFARLLPVTNTVLPESLPFRKVAQWPGALGSARDPAPALGELPLLQGGGQLPERGVTLCHSSDELGLGPSRTSVARCGGGCRGPCSLGNQLQGTGAKPCGLSTSGGQLFANYCVAGRSWASSRARFLLGGLALLGSALVAAGMCTRRGRGCSPSPPPLNTHR